MFDRICSFGNLLGAYRRARKAGRNAPGAAAFDYALEPELWRLHDELRSGAYRPCGYRSFYVHVPKTRLVSAAPFRDRVVHHALVGVLEPRFERRFIHDSYACRKGKGTHRAVDRGHRFVRRFRHCLRTDVVRFFPSVDHAILLRILDLPCPRTRELVAVILDGGKKVLRREFPDTLFRGDDLLALLRPRGLPIGNLTSQFFANVFLDPLDHFVKDELGVKGYVRYADDLRLFSDSKSRLHALHRELERFCAGLRLSLHDRKTQVQPCRAGVPFLGFVLYPGGRRKLLRASARRFRKRLRHLARDLEAGRIDQKRVRASVQSMLAHANHAHTRRLMEQILSEVTFRCGPRSS